MGGSIGVIMEVLLELVEFSGSALEACITLLLLQIKTFTSHSIGQWCLSIASPGLAVATMVALLALKTGSTAIFLFPLYRGNIILRPLSRIVLISLLDGLNH